MMQSKPHLILNYVSLIAALLTTLLPFSALCPLPSAY